MQPNPARSYALKALLGFGFRRRDPDEQLWDLLQDALDGAAQDDDWAYGAALRGQAARLMSNCPGRAEEALALFAEARQYADAHDDAVHRFQSWINEADFLVALGRNAEAAQLCRAGLAAAAVHGASPVTWQYLRGNLAQALVGLGELAEAQHLLEQELCVDWPNLEWAGEYVLLGLVRVWRGEVEEATEAAEAAHHRLDGADVDPQLRVPLATLDAELALASGDREAALDIAARGCDRDAGNVWPVLVWPLLRVAARAAAPRRPGWLTEAVRRQAERYPPVPAAREEVEAVLSGRDVKHAVADRPVTGPAALTPREREVLELLAAGRSNAAIAAELVISPKTASVHVSHILEKLLVRSRGEAAALAWRRGLVGAAADTSPRRGR